MPLLLLKTAEAAASRLAEYGSSHLAYVTAEFEPYSSAQRPDIVFVPTDGPNAGSTFFTEIRLTHETRRALLTPTSLAEHRAFIQDEFEGYLFFALAISLKAPERDRAALAGHGIDVLDSVESGEMLASKILTWAQTAVRPITT